jgi:hypothetical protein
MSTSTSKSGGQSRNPHPASPSPPITQAAQGFGRWMEAALQATDKTQLNGSGCQKQPPYKLAASMSMHMRQARALARTT